MTRIAIIGVGALGCLFGARLSRVADVTLVGRWRAQLAALQNTGLRLIGPNGQHHHYRLCATNDLRQVSQMNLVLLLVKSPQTARAAQQAARLLAPDGLALTLQNGLGNLEVVTAAVGSGRAIAGVTTQGATVVAPGIVRHAADGPTQLGRAPGLTTALTDVIHLFQAAGLHTELVDNVDSLIWGKLAVSAAINPLTALLKVPNGHLAEESAARQIMLAAAREVAAVAAAEGIRLPYPDAGERALAVARATAGNRSSMLQDVERGAVTEIDAICGAVVRLGQKHGLATPVNNQLWLLVKAVEAGRPLPSPQAVLESLSHL
jgi:2-dehydropantoate 2-reductase